MRAKRRESIRAFFALSLTDAMRDEIERKIAPLRRKEPPVRWVPPENLHVTIRFLGDLMPNLRGRLERRAQEAVRSLPSFSFRLGSCGAFPSPARPRVLWVGLSEGDEAVCGLARTVEKSLGGLGFEPERRFHPHITVGRVKAALGRALREEFTSLRMEPLDKMARALDLMQSTLTPEGAHYRVVRSFSLVE